MRKSAIPCTICGKAAPPGALLCPPCRAALKRAGHLTVQDLPHYRSPVRRSRGQGYRASGAKRPPPTASVPVEVAGTGRRVLLATAGLAVLAVAAYVGRTSMDPEPDARAARTIADVYTAPPATGRSAAAVPAATAAAPTASAATAPAPQALEPTETLVEPSRPVSPRTPQRTKQAALRAEATVAPSPLPAAENVAVAPEPPPTPAPREAPPPPDRWQQMSDALARCDREGGFSGFICDQRVRLDSCEGYWGQVPQCPNPPENPR